MNKYLKNYLAYKYHKIDTVSLEQQNEYVRFKIKRLNNKAEYLDKKGDALGEKLDKVFFANDKQLDYKQRNIAIAKTFASTVLPGAVLGGVIGATVVASSPDVPVEEVADSTRAFFGVYGAGLGAMTSTGLAAFKSENMQTLVSAIVNNIREKSVEKQLDNFQQKDKMINKELTLRFDKPFQSNKGKEDEIEFDQEEEAQIVNEFEVVGENNFLGETQIEEDIDEDEEDNANLFDYVDITGEFDDSNDLDM